MLIWLDGPLGLALIVVLLLLAIGWYLSYLAARLDRLHHRVESSRAALEARLARRAAVALKVVRLLGPPAGERLSHSANRTLQGSDDDDRPSTAPAWAGGPIPQPPINERRENEL